MHQRMDQKLTFTPEFSLFFITNLSDGMGNLFFIETGNLLQDLHHFRSQHVLCVMSNIIDALIEG